MRAGPELSLVIRLTTIPGRPFEHCRALSIYVCHENTHTHPELKNNNPNPFRASYPQSASPRLVSYRVSPLRLLVYYFRVSLGAITHATEISHARCNTGVFGPNSRPHSATMSSHELRDLAADVSFIPGIFDKNISPRPLDCDCYLYARTRT